ncbi:MAG: AraC family transcriptional regulator [Nevskiales bacterium]
MASNSGNDPDMIDARPGLRQLLFPNIYPQMLLGYAQSCGLNTEQVLEDTGLSADALGNPESSIRQGAYRTLVENTVRLLGQPELGLRIGQQLNLGAHGYVGYAAMSSPTVGHALRMGAKYYETQGRPAVFEFVARDGQAGFDFDLPIDATGQPVLYRYIMEIAVATTLGALRFYFGGQLPPLKVALKYLAPHYAQRYTELLGVEVAFGQSGNRIRFDQALLEHPLASANPTLARMAERQCEAILAAQCNRKNDLPAQIERLLIRQAGHFPSQDEVAGKLHMSPRNLRFQLQKQGTRYQAILSGVRRELSLHYLQSTNMTVDEIAYLLDYSDTASFTRAFRKWTGQSPTQAKAASDSA